MPVPVVALPQTRSDLPALQFDRVPLYQFLRVLYGEVLGEAYLIDDAVQSSVKTVSVDLRGASINEVRSFAELLLHSFGLVAERHERVIYIRNGVADDEEKALLVYSPQNRSATYLLGVVRGFFPAGTFGGAVGASAASVGSSSASVGGGPGMAAGNSGAAVSGASAPSAALSGGGAGLAQGAGAPDKVVFRGSGSEMKKLASMLRQVDVPAGELVVHASIYEVQVHASEASGVQMAAKILGGFLSFDLSGTVSGPFFSFKLGNSFQSAVSALSSDSRFKTISTPVVRVRSGEAARMSVGTDVPVLGNVTVAGNGIAQQSVSYVPSGVLLEVKPLALADRIEVVVSQQLSAFELTTSGVNASPTLLKREISTSLSLQDGEAVLIGGLDEVDATKAANGVSFLPRWLWGTSTDDLRTELVVVLKVDRLRSGV